MSASTNDQFLTVTEAAQLLKVSTSTVWRWIDGGTLTAYRVGQRRVVLRADEVRDAVVAERGARREGVKPMATDSSHLSPLSDAEAARLHAAMERAKAVRAQILDERGGKPLPASSDLLRELRDERSAHL